MESSGSRLGRQLILALASALVVVAGFELYLRASAAPAGLRAFEGVPHPDYHHLHPPNAEMFAGLYEDTPILVRTNEDGFRTAYSRAEFVRHAPRVAILGDSFVFGFLVPEENALPRRLEAILRLEPGLKEAAVLNAGIISSSPMLQRRLFDGVVRHYEPDLVVLVLDAGDIGDDWAYAEQLLAGTNRFDVPEAPTGGIQLRVFEVLRPLWEILARPFAPDDEPPDPHHYGDFRFELAIGEAIETNRFFVYRHPLEVTRPYFDATLAHIRALADSVHATGAGFALVVSPRFHHWNPAESPANWEDRLYARNEPHQYALFRYFEEARARVDFPIHDLLADFRATQEFPLVFARDPHWNSQGHAFVARAIAQALQEAELLPRR